MSSSKKKTITIIGGGVTGLSAARSIAQHSPNTNVVLLEKSAYLGGHIRTIQTPNGTTLDAGPESLVTYHPNVIKLCKELGLEEQLIEPSVSRTMLYTRGKLRPMPPRIMEGSPGSTTSIAKSGVLSPLGFLRAGLDLLIPKTKYNQPISIGELIERRIGKEAASRLVDPLLGGIHASSIWNLDAKLLAPQIFMTLENNRSLIRGMRAASKKRITPSGASVFRSLSGGLKTLISALEDDISQLGIVVKTNTTVTNIELDTSITLSDKTNLHSDKIIAAIPAWKLATMLPNEVSYVSDKMRSIKWASTATCVLEFLSDDIPELKSLSGVLIPKVEGEGIKAITCVTSKWGTKSNDPSQFVIKCYLGYAEDKKSVTLLSDEQITERVLDSLKKIANVTAKPKSILVERFEKAIPQYAPGHSSVVDSIEQDVLSIWNQRLILAGASWHGSGIGLCMSSGMLAAEKAIKDLD